MVDINIKKLRGELLYVLENFLENPSNEEMHRRAAIISRDYSGLCIGLDIFEKNIPEDILCGIGSMSHIYIYNAGSGITNEEIIKVAKNTLKKLKE